MMRPVGALVLNGFREARRNRISVLVVAFALLLLLGSHFAIELTVYTFERVLTDLGLGGMTVALVFLAIFLSTGMLTKEIERRTLFLIISKPVSRAAFLLARVAGIMLTLLVQLLVMTLLFYGQLLLNDFSIKSPVLVATGMLVVELLLISSVGIFMSSFATQLVSAVVTTGMYLLGHLTPSLYSLASASESAVVRQLGTGAYYLLPNLSRLSYRPQASHGLSSPASEVLQSAAYGLTYSAILLTLAILIFRRRDLR